MSKILIAAFGSLGDLHPKIALALELRERGHEVVIASSEVYKEKVNMIGLDFVPIRPNLNPHDRELARHLMDTKNGTERLIREVLMPNVAAMYEDLIGITALFDMLITGEVVYAAASVVEKTGVKWISTSLAPLSMFSASDPNVYPTAEWYEKIHFLPTLFHRNLFKFMRSRIDEWYVPYKDFRRKIGLSENHDPIFDGKYSKNLHLAMFSKVLAKPQPDWYARTLQTGFCFYDGQEDLGAMPPDLEKFLDAGDPPIVFTLGSAAVMDAGNFFDESITAARKLKRRAVLLYGIFNEPPDGLNENIAAFNYAPFSKLFPRAACVVHSGGIGTTAQVLRAGVPHVFVPFANDQPDNAARTKRLGAAEIIARRDYKAERAARTIAKVLSDLSYKAAADEARKIVISENGTKTACDAIESILKS